MPTNTEVICRLFGEKPPNMNHESGIHYGFISSRKVNEFALSDIYDSGEDLSYAEAVDNIKGDIRARLVGATDWLDNEDDIDRAVERVWDVIEPSFNDGYESQDSSYRYDDGSCLVVLQPDGDICVLQSPYYTMAAECSPCAPNAGYITSEGGLKTYCLGHNWFNDDKAPYKVYSVETGEEVPAESDHCCGDDCRSNGCTEKCK